MITLHDLNSHADLVIQLNTARQMLAAFQSAVLRASSIDGMPHAPSAGNGKVEALVRTGDQVLHCRHSGSASELDLLPPVHMRI